MTDFKKMLDELPPPTLRQLCEQAIRTVPSAAVIYLDAREGLRMLDEIDRLRADTQSAVDHGRCTALNEVRELAIVQHQCEHIHSESAFSECLLCKARGLVDAEPAHFKRCVLRTPGQAEEP